MSLQTTPKGDRLQIVLYGKRNAGKSSVLNGITGQNLAIVSEIKGTTTDPVSKAMEILPLGPCMFTDTPGLDDEGELGQKRIEKALLAMHKADIALIVVDINQITEEDLNREQMLPETESEIIKKIEAHSIPYIVVLNQIDKMPREQVDRICKQIQNKNPNISVVPVSATERIGMDELKDALISRMPQSDLKLHILSDLIEPQEMVVLVVPIDSAAPKGRLIMPQQQVIRDILDHHGAAVVTQVPELAGVLEALKGKVKLVVTDSQAFKEVSAIVPKEIKLTSFSILFARHKGNLDDLVNGVRAVDTLQDGDHVLIAEGCTHRRQCEDIGTVKIPNWLKQKSGKALVIETCSGTEFPENLDKYALVIHCGGCTLHEKEMKYRIACAKEQGVPIVNYGIFIAYVNGILQRSVEVFPAIHEKLVERE